MKDIILLIRVISRNNNASSMLGWSAVIIWFSANILSQAAFIGTHGVPYDAAQIILALGPWSWVLIAVELIVWVIFGIMILLKIKSTRDEKVISSC